MKKTFKMTAIAAALAGLAGPAMADQAETKGGLTVKTDDGRFEFKLGGRLHIDAYDFLDCKVNSADCAAGSTVNGMFLRRGYLTMTGKLYGWKFKWEIDPSNPAATTNTATTGPVATASAATMWREAWVSTDVGAGELVIGQFKPYRSMEELTSSNEILIMERPYSSASSLYGGGTRQYQMGVGYKLPFELGVSGMWATDVHTLHAIGQPASEGIGYASRLTVLPVEQDGFITHVGVSYNVDDSQNGFQGSSTAGTSATGLYQIGPGTTTIAGRNSTNQVTSPTVSSGTLGASASGGSQSTYAAELASTFGPGFVQAEYAKSTVDQIAPLDSQDVVTYYVQGSFFLTGETKPYKKDRGTFGSPKPFNSYGAWELVARYDTIKNDDKLATSATYNAQPEIVQITVGVNWYVNPNVRFMLNYSMGEAEIHNNTAVTQKTEVDALAVRTQLSF